MIHPILIKLTRPWRKSLIFSILAVLLLTTLFTPALYSQEVPAIRSVSDTPFARTQGEYFEGEVLIRFREGVSEERRSSFRREMAVEESRPIGRTDLELVRMDPERAHQMIERGVLHPDLEVFQPNYVYRMIEPVQEEDSQADAQLHEVSGTLPNDPEFFRQWGLYNKGNKGQDFREGLIGTEGADIDAARAWTITTGSHEVIVAVFDTGIDYNHPDLEDNIFRDPQGRPGVDCSPSGMIAPGVCGEDPIDEHGHGTHIAGVIGAVGNNGLGIAGINWEVQLMAVKIFSEDPNSGNQVSSTASILAGYDYALSHGARISNHSYGSSSPDPAHRTRIEQAALQDHMVFAAAGNSGNNNDTNSEYPASYDLDNVISVAATDYHDQLSTFSNYGPESVHIAAPGEHIFSTFLGGYAYRSGTSMATPHVAGAAGLVWSVFPTFGYRDVRDLLLDEADRLPSLETRIQNARRLNAFQSIPTAGLEFVHAYIDPDVESIRIEVNGEPLVEDLVFTERGRRVHVLADQEIQLSIYDNNVTSGIEPMYEESVQFERDINYYVVLADEEEGGGSGPALYSNRLRELDVASDEVRLIFLNTVKGLQSAGLFGFFADDRPSFVVTEHLSFGEFLDDYRIRPNNVEIDLTRDDTLLESFLTPLLDDGGETVLAIATGSAGAGEQEMVLSRGVGMGEVAAKVTTPGREPRHVPDRFVLEENFPNPFYPNTQIQFTLPDDRDVRLDIYDVLGRRVQTLVDDWMPGGIHRVEFDASGLSSGVYLYRVRAGDDQESGKMLLVR